mmetsp:Transcript_31423/g.27777  ORF Transcript_31423/g.27777 Transcript_31423/m.27777 type:complete len:91 (-) Transcript_31423:583-855(-)
MLIDGISMRSKGNKISSRKNKVRLAHSSKIWTDMQTLIPEIIPVSGMIKAIKSGKAKLFLGRDDMEIADDMVFEASWDPKSKLNDVLAKT